MKLHGLSGFHVIGQGDRSALLIRPDDVAHEKIAAAELLAVLADRAPDKQAVLEKAALGFGDRVHRLSERLHGGFPAELLDHVLARAGNDHRPADGPATLAHNRL